MSDSLISRVDLKLGMQSDREMQALDLLDRYTAGELPVREFAQRFVPLMWGIETDHIPTRLDVGAVDLRLIEFSNGDWTEDELKEELRLLVQRHRDSEAIAT